MNEPRRLRFNAFSMNCPTHLTPGLWVRPDTRQLEYLSLDPWLDLARLLERGRFDALFLADTVGTSDAYGGSRATYVKEGAQFPTNDPSLLLPAMAGVTEDLGFAFTSSVLQDHPFAFARRLSTIDHLTKGRVAWNIVTSFLDSAARNLGHGGLLEHDERYEWAEEYVDVLYKLLEGSWEDDAVVRDLEAGIYADPSKVHDIDHHGRFYPEVRGPHLSEPSPQRTPVLFQAGSSDAGREFAAKNAEAVFTIARNTDGARKVIADVRSRAERHGRDPDDLLFYVGLNFIVGGTEEEARKKAEELDAQVHPEGLAAMFGGSLNVDFSAYDLDSPIREIETEGVQGVVKGFLEAAPDKNWTLGDLLRYMSDNRVVGTPEQIADALQEWSDAGIDGINIRYMTTPGTFEDFIDGVTPVLQERGLQQRDYRPGTLREKLTDGRSGPRLNARHPGRAYARSSVAS